MGTVTIAQGTQLLPQPWPSREGVGEIDHLPLSPSVSQSPTSTSHWPSVTRGQRAKEASNAVHSGQSVEAQSRVWSTGEYAELESREESIPSTRLFTLRAWGPRIKVPTRDSLKHMPVASLTSSPTAAVEDPGTKGRWAQKYLLTL